MKICIYPREKKSWWGYDDGGWNDKCERHHQTPFGKANFGLKEFKTIHSSPVNLQKRYCKSSRWSTSSKATKAGGGEGLIQLGIYANSRWHASNCSEAASDEIASDSDISRVATLSFDTDSLLSRLTTDDLSRHWRPFPDTDGLLPISTA
jgi:hypothetical protein